MDVRKEALEEGGWTDSCWSTPLRQHRRELQALLDTAGTLPLPIPEVQASSHQAQGKLWRHCQASLHRSPSQHRGHMPQHQFVRAI